MTYIVNGPELLRAFLDDNEVSQNDAADALHVTRVTVWTWLNRRATPSEQLRLDIETWTSGKIPRAAWGPLPDKRRGKNPEVTPFEPDDSNGDEPGPPESERTIPNATDPDRKAAG